MSFWPTNTGEWIALGALAVLALLPWAVLIQTVHEERRYHADVKRRPWRRRR